MLVKSKVAVIDNQLEITLPVKGVDFLKAKRFDKELAKLIYNLYGKEYIINLKENVSQEEIIATKEKLERAEKIAVERTMEHWATSQKEEQETENEKEREKKSKEEKKEEIVELKETIIEEETPLIYGRNLNCL